MSQAIKVGIFATIVLAVLAVLILRIEEIHLFAASEQRVDALFDSVAGLDDKAAVRVAGVRVGRVDGIALDGGRARVTLLLETPVALTAGSRAAVASSGLLGDKYINLIPGPPGAPALPPGTVLEGETPVSFDEAMAHLDAVGRNVERLTGSLAGGEGEESQITRLLSNLEQVSAQTRDLLAANRDQVTATVANFEQASATLARELPRLADRMESVLAEVGRMVAENRGNVGATLAQVRQITADLEPAVADLKTISGRLAAGEGTIGKLLTSDEAHDQLVSTLASIKGGVDGLADTLGAVQKLHLDLGLEGYYLDSADKGQSSFRLDLKTRSDWRYRIAVVDPAFPEARIKTQRITVTNPDGSQETRTTETVTQEDHLAISALLGAQLRRDLMLRAGLIESSFGVEAEYPLVDRKLWLSLEAFDFNRKGGLDPHLRLTSRWRLLPNIYLVGGYDDFLVGDRHSLFFGAGIRWNDDDLKYLLGSVPTKF
jgi:phospholipid/cholesterol/gamma-HCH transport system substrate-binding protein